MKSEGMRKIRVPLRRDLIRHELGLYTTWYNAHRPHQGLGGRTPTEVYAGVRPANEAPRFEPRVRWPRRSACASPPAQVRGKCGVTLALVVDSVEGRTHLPIVKLKLTA